MSEKTTDMAVADNAVAKRDNGQIVVADPFNPTAYHVDAQSVIASMYARRDERRAEMDELGDADGNDPRVKALKRAIEDDDAALKDYKTALDDALLAMSGFKAVIVQMKGTKTRIDPLSVRGAFAKMLKDLNARLDAVKPPEETDKHLLLLDCTEKAWKDIDRYLSEKVGVNMGMSVRLHTTAHVERAAKLFDSVVTEGKKSAAAMDKAMAK